MIGDNIKRLREEHNMTQMEFAKICGVSDKAVSTWEQNIKVPRMGTLQKMADYFGVPKSAIIEDKKIDNFITYPVVVGIKAGYDGEIIFEESGDSEQIPTEWIRGDSPSNFFVARVHGDSMYPMFIEGDRVLVHKTPSVDSGSVCAIRINENEITLKRVIYKQGEDWLELQPINTSYPPKRIEGLDLKDCGVIGEVKKLIRAL